MIPTVRTGGGKQKGGILNQSPRAICNFRSAKRPCGAVECFKADGPGLGKGGTGVLSVDGKEVARNSMKNSTPITFPEDESFDIGQDTRTGVAMLEYRYDPPFKFTGKINKLTFKLEPVAKEALAEPRAELGPMAAPEPDPIEEPKP